MKKIITTILIIISFAIFPLMVSASANKVTFKETSKGKLATTIHFEEGFVGGIDLTIKLEGNIKFKKFDFNNNITQKKYETKQSYNEKNKTLNIKITTGGINSEHNLLNSNKELSLGNLILSSSSKNNVDYKLIINNLTYIDNSWKSVEINDITNKEQEFTYKVTTESTDNNNDKTTTDKTEEDKKETNDKNDTTEDNKTTSNNKDNTTNNKNENNDKTTNDKNSSNSSSKEPTTNKDENNEQDNNVEDNSSEEDDNETEQEPENSSTDETSEKEESNKEEPTELNKKEIIIIIGVCIAIVSGAIIFIIKIKR